MPWPSISSLEQKLADHGLSPDDFEAVISDPVSVDRSRSSGRRGAFGYTPDGRYITCFYELLDDAHHRDPSHRL